ncbi:hypothetical protein TorRG33x02_253050 [Trema orientale]|uniref:Uncharacterized protein n=1 Tax=Trema orientale TaxID=63057 RepID=A0A2P5DFW8_TREOI|nr:hypothetical protein TorRG33x02_253050 [Trema orientale]
MAWPREWTTCRASFSGISQATFLNGAAVRRMLRSRARHSAHRRKPIFSVTRPRKALWHLYV